MNLSHSKEILETLSWIWNLSVITVDQKTITIGNLLSGLFVIIGGFWLSSRASRRVTHGLMVRFLPDESLRDTIETLVFYLLLLTFLLLGLSFANFPMSAFTVAGGALAIGVGFGSQNVVNNFISGIILMLERPVKIGDYIEVDGLFGKVQRIGFRSTTVLAFGNRHLIVPNSSFLERNVLNWTLADRLVRVTVGVGVAYGSPTKKVEALLREAVLSVPNVLSEPAPLILFKHFGESSLDFEIAFSIELKELRDMECAASSLRYAIDECFRAEGITIAFPQRDVHFFTDKPIDVRVAQEK